jgi:hypothetical protein
MPYFQKIDKGRSLVGDYIASLGWYGTVREVIVGVAAAARLSGIKQGYPGPGFVSQGPML